MAERSTPGGNIYWTLNAEVTDSANDYLRARNRDARDREIKDIAQRALDSVAGRLRIALESGANVDVLSDGRYYAVSAAIAASLVGGPTEGVSRQACIIDVRSASASGAIKVIEWTTIPNTADPMLTWRKHYDGTTWSPWDQDGAARRVKSGTDVFTLPPGRWSVANSTIAQSLVNRPSPAVAGQAANIDVYGVGNSVGRLVRYQIIPNRADTPLVWEVHRDTAGSWSGWSAVGDDAATLTGTEDYRALKPGTYIVPNGTVGVAMTNRPTGGLSWASGASVVEVVAGSNANRTVTITETPNAAQQSRTVMMHRDNGGAWSGWYQTGASSEAPTGEAALPTLAPLADVQHQHLRGMTRLAMATEPDTHPGRWTAPAGSKLTTPTPDGSGQTVHPKVIDTITGWGGHRYWMAHTPYPFADDSKEDPCLLVSPNGTTWTTPTGVTNPLDDQPGSPGFYNSDTHLVLHEGTMYLTWRTSRVTPQIEDEISWRTSTDGVTWTPKHTLYRSAAPGTVYGQMLSPALLKTSTGWRMYLVAANADPNRMVYVETTAATPGPADWSAPVRCHFGSPGKDQFILGRDVWHIDVIQDGTAYWALLNDCAQRTGGLHGDLYLARSQDGVAWEVGPVPLLPRYGAGHDALYRGSLIKSGAGFDVTYSARVSQNQRFHLYRTTAARDV